jgi:hypothetical protein
MIFVPCAHGGGGGEREAGGTNHMTSLITLLWRGEGVNRQVCPGFLSHLYSISLVSLSFFIFLVLLEGLSQ